MRFELGGHDITPEEGDETKYLFQNEDALNWAYRTGKPVLWWYWLTGRQRVLEAKKNVELPPSFNVSLM